MKRFFICLFLAVSILAASAQPMNEFATKQLNVLVFSKTVGWRHNSISNGIKMISDLGLEKGWEVTSTEDPSLFTMDFLVNFDVVVFLNPTLDVMSEKQQEAFKTFMKIGKGFVGIHASADCEYDWDWYGRLNGAFFRTHPPAQEGTVVFEDYNHPSMKVFEGMETYTTFDEWYSFKANPREHVKVLARLDESSITKPNKNNDWQMEDHPVIWYQEFDGIRSFYTVFGHTPEAFDDPNVKTHISGAIEWAGKLVD